MNRVIGLVMRIRENTFGRLRYYLPLVVVRHILTRLVQWHNCTEFKAWVKLLMQNSVFHVVVYYCEGQ